MIRRDRILLPILMIALTTSAAAQGAANDALLDAACVGSSVELTVGFDIRTDLPEHWAGWVIDRTSIGVCEPTARVVGPEAFPSGEASLSFVDASAVPGQAYAYAMRPVDAQGSTLFWWIPDDMDFFPPAYYQIDRTTCFDAPAVRGRLIDLGWSVGIEVCEGQCWTMLAFISELPAELAPLVGTDTVVELRGTLADEFEGPYLAEVTGWRILPDCSVVATTATTWSGIKARFH
jgi:hypothetical protein